jgi:hypothetical protein
VLFALGFLDFLNKEDQYFFGKGLSSMPVIGAIWNENPITWTIDYFCIFIFNFHLAFNDIAIFTQPLAERDWTECQCQWAAATCYGDFRTIGFIANT